MFTNGVRAGYRVAFFDLVTRGMAKQFTTGNVCSGKELWGWAITSVFLFFIYKLFVYMHSAY